MGEVGSSPKMYSIYRAAQVLNCSYMELANHPDRDTLMSIAFTIAVGESDGEHALRCNPKFKRLAKERHKQYG